MDNYEKFYLLNSINKYIHNNVVINNQINTNNISIKNNNKPLRIYYFDILRIVSSFFVVLIHVSAKYYANSNINSNNWKIAYYYNGVSRFGVPVFLMISGALFLSREVSFSKILKKYIGRLLTKLIFWSFIYSIYITNLSIKNIQILIINFVLGNYHFWFIMVIIELYLITPFLREIIKKEDLLNF